MIRIACLVFLMVIGNPCISIGETVTMFANHKYVMGDNDSKNDARRMCLLEAKRRILEKAGTYIESRTEVKEFQLTKDEISAYAAAFLKVDVVREEWKFVGENMAIFMSVKAEIDTGYIEKQLSKIKQDVSLKKEMEAQQSRLQELERTVINLQKQLAKGDASEARYLQNKRNIVLEEIDRLQAHKEEILGDIEFSTKDAIDYIERGMTKEEVKQLLGEPRAVEQNYDYWNYGKVWVIIENGLVQCVVYSQCYDVLKDCSDYTYSCIAK